MLKRKQDNKKIELEIFSTVLIFKFLGHRSFSLVTI